MIEASRVERVPFRNTNATVRTERVRWSYSLCAVVRTSGGVQEVGFFMAEWLYSAPLAANAELPPDPLPFPALAVWKFLNSLAAEFSPSTSVTKP